MGRRTPEGKPPRKTYLFKMHFYENVVFCLQTTFFDGFTVLMSFLAQKSYRTVMKSHQKAIFGTNNCKILICSCIFPILFLGPNPDHRGPQVHKGPQVHREP